MKNEKYSLYKVDELGGLKEMLNYAAEKYGGKTAFSFMEDGAVVYKSYQDFKADVEALGTAFAALNLKNEKIAVIGENSYRWIVTYFAAVNGQNIIVPIDKELSAAEIQNLLLNSQCCALIHSDNYRGVADEIAGGELSLKYKWNMTGELDDLIQKGRSLITAGDRTFIDMEIDCEVLCSLIYTSGTTGTPKGVMLSHKNLAHNTSACCKNLSFSGDSMLVLPLHHTFALTAGVLVMLQYGCTIAINSSLKSLNADLNTYKPVNMFLVPLFVETFYKQIWKSARKSQKDKLLRRLITVSNSLLKIGIDVRRKLFKSVLDAFGGNLELIVSGGAPLDARYVRGMRDFGIQVLNGYGITECSPVIAVNRTWHYRDGSVGQVLSGCEVRVSDPDENNNGEILARGDNVMLGYYNNEAATSAAFEDGWFKTGDLGYLDKDGFLFVTGRIKNLIVLSNGKNVYPEELEETLLSIPLVEEVVVRAEDFGRRDKTVLTAEIFPNFELAKELGIDDLPEYFDREVAAVNQTLPIYKRIQQTVLRDREFAKTTTKKIKRGVRV